MRSARWFQSPRSSVCGRAISSFASWMPRGIRGSSSQTPKNQGYFDRDVHDEWLPFRSFEAPIRIDLDDLNLRQFDLDGDGRADLLIAEENALGES